MLNTAIQCSIALYQLNALNLPNMYLIYIQLHSSNCNSSIPIFSICQMYVPIHPMHSIHRLTALHQFNALHLPKMCPHTSHALPSIDQLHFINSMLSVYPRCAPIHPMHSHPSTNCTSSIQCSPFTQDVPPYIQCTPSIDQLHFINSTLSIYPRCAPNHPMHSIHPFMEFGGF